MSVNYSFGTTDTQITQANGGAERAFKTVKTIWNTVDLEIFAVKMFSWLA